MEANPFTLRAFPPVSFTMSRGRGNLTLSPPLPAFSSPADTSPIFYVVKHRGGGRDFQTSLFYYILVPFHFVGITFMYTYGNIGEWFVFVAGALSLLPCAALAV